jgi:hypothetical protein
MLVILQQKTNLFSFKSVLWSHWKCFCLLARVALDLMHFAYEGEAKHELANYIEFAVGAGYFTVQELVAWLKVSTNWPMSMRHDRRIRHVSFYQSGSFRGGAAEVKSLMDILPTFLKSTQRVPMEWGRCKPTSSLLFHHLILKMVCAKEGITEESLQKLPYIIYLWSRLFSESYGWVRPKTHDYRHLPESIRRLGNMRTYWTFAFESYHRTPKRMYANGNKKPGFEKFILEDCFFNFMMLNGLTSESTSKS